MLQYMRKYRLMAHALVGAIPITLVVIVSLLTGVSVISAPWGWILVIGSIVVANLLVSRYAAKSAEDRAQKILDIFNQQCSPQAFLEEAAPLAREIVAQAPFDEWGAWFLSSYSSALIDQDKKTEASTAVLAMSKSAQAADKPLVKFDIIINMYTPIKELDERDLADQCLQEAERLIADNPQVAKDKGVGFVTWARSVLAAEESDDETALVRLYDQNLMSQNVPPRMKVWLADQAAMTYRHLDDREAEKERLGFVVKHGNTMNCVEAARERLRELSS